jgi:hypothetical protein
MQHSFFFPSAHKMEAADSSETLAFKYQIVRHHIPNYNYLNYKQYIPLKLWYLSTKSYGIWVQH